MCLACIVHLIGAGICSKQTKIFYTHSRQFIFLSISSVVVVVVVCVFFLMSEPKRKESIIVCQFQIQIISRATKNQQTETTTKANGGYEWAVINTGLKSDFNISNGS